MSDRHLAYWPKNVPRHLVIPETNVFYNLEVSAHRYPEKPYLIYYDTSITFPELKDEAERMAGFLERECGVKKGDRVLLFMQNSPQFVIAYYAIMRANAVVVPINTMNLTNGLRQYVLDSDAETALVAQELYPQVKPLIGRELKRVIVAAYSDYLKQATDLRIPELVAAPRQPIADPGVALWSDAMARNLRPGPITARPDDLCVMPPRWDREVAAQLIQRYRITAWQCIPTMVVDFLANPKVLDYDLKSLERLSGGGAAMPEAVAKRLQDKFNIEFVEGYGLTETMAPSHINPPERPKKQCLGIPIFDVDARVVDPETFRELPPGEVGEIIVNGPQVLVGYWKNPKATAEAFVETDGKRFFRTGDLARTDEDGYFFLVDRLKRMINASGFKVWPAEVESLLYQHPAVQEACVIAARDPHRGETVKAVVVLKPDARGKVSGQDIIGWASKQMAAYKYPRIVEFGDALPKSATGKVQWRLLQEQENSRQASA